MCKGESEEVKEITVKHFVVNSLVNKVTEDTYCICLSEGCDVVYFNLEKDVIFTKHDIKIPIWYKKNANPKYICYCSKITEEQIVDAVINDGARSIKDIIKITGAMKNSNCEINNPLGKCCGPFIKEVIDKIMNIK
ncbi:BFD-like [2Fe-2S] binding domain-containing protein [Paramaledivibacter caminithermalis DSM 15212]|uniref:BFD-like [2Fe-2S] binding domain-containing protein n=1 Tax=Paramaledivibacter caminithermalis (strain DSM 15212 / CIP 107654 / DViRD3) TaxID=1121301 RepID=A0A1M6LWW2_PARC5|nr:(2Fe-2S)-binding protein [Paramaledivibacter caminithermalis]SHJ75641.1 BFD-like [2Fe-2S] binding domain-containing protein [Paramaledivibacter caminithermalis DSM 15212]